MKQMLETNRKREKTPTVVNSDFHDKSEMTREKNGHSKLFSITLFQQVLKMPDNAHCRLPTAILVGNEANCCRLLNSVLFLLEITL